MYINKRVILLVLMSVIVAMPMFGQRFTKKEQALREARSINYFYGNSFTLSTGYVHGWLARDRFDDSAFGRTGQYSNTRNSYAFAFAWDYCKSRHHGFQFSLDYAQFGGEEIFFEDQGLGYGRQRRYDLTEQIHVNEVMLVGLYRYYIPLTYKSRLSLNAGAYFARVTGTYDDAKDWDMGAVVGLGYDWKHLSLTLNYLPGCYPNIIDGSTTRISAVMFNVGYHIWK